MPIEIIVYTDKETVRNIKEMGALGIPYQLIPPVSGPAIERMVLKMERDLAKDPAATEKKAKANYNYNLGGNKEGGMHALQMMLSDVTQDTLSYFNQDTGENSSSENQKKQSATAMKGSSPTEDSSTQRFSQSQPKPRRNALNRDSVMVRGAELALEEASNKTETKVVQKIEASQNCVCIIIESTRFNGYLVAAMGKNRKIDGDFVASIQGRLFEFLRRQGENVSDDDGCEVKLRQVEFEDWALEQADFLKKSIHNGDEVAMAFFPTEKVNPDIIAAENDENMLQINLDDIQGDVTVNFNVYVYLPTNNKYVLMTPKGGTFLGEQKARLKTKGISHMHMRKEEVKDAKQYTAQNYLNNKIEEFYSKKKPGSSKNEE
jgi:hypothetical protein